LSCRQASGFRLGRDDPVFRDAHRFEERRLFPGDAFPGSDQLLVGQTQALAVVEGRPLQGVVDGFRPAQGHHGNEQSRQADRKMDFMVGYFFADSTEWILNRAGTSTNSGSALPR